MLHNTKQLFADAICKIAQNKPIDKITITDIVRYCGAGRQTFYYHFKDKYDLINWIYTNNANQILGIRDNYQNFRENSVKILEHFAFHKQFYTKAINMEGQNTFLDAFFNHTCSFYRNKIVHHFGKEVLTDEMIFTIEFNCYGAVNMCKKWLNADMSLSMDEMIDRILESMPEKLKYYVFGVDQ